MLCLGQIDISGYLFERSQPLRFIKRNKLHRSQETSRSGCDVDHWEYCIFEVTFPQKGDLGLFGNSNAFNFVVFHRCHELLCQFLFDIACMSTINHHRITVLVSKISKVVKRYHTMFHTKIVNILMHERIVRLVSQRTTTDRYMIKKTARATIRSMYGTHKSPTFRQKFTDCSGFHLSKVSSSVDGPKM